MGEFVQHRGEHFPAYGAVRTMGFFRRGTAVGQAGQQLAIEVELRHQRRLTVSVARHVVGPADIDATVQLLDEAWRQCLHRFIQQCLAGLLLCRAQAFGLEV
ncbi:hypothetical protein D3C84_640500 [compost metagenome]